LPRSTIFPSTAIFRSQGLSQGFVANFDRRGDGSFETSATIVSNQKPPAAPVLTFRGQVLGAVLSGTIVELGATFSATIDPPAGPDRKSTRLNSSHVKI